MAGVGNIFCKKFFFVVHLQTFVYGVCVIENGLASEPHFLLHSVNSLTTAHRTAGRAQVQAAACGVLAALAVTHQAPAPAQHGSPRHRILRGEAGAGADERLAARNFPYQARNVFKHN